MDLESAKKIAIETGNLLFPYCERLKIAGSIRRGNPEVKDIEIVCEPKKTPVGQMDFFNSEPQQMKASPDFSKTVFGLGKVLKGNPDGRYMQIELNIGKLLHDHPDPRYRQIDRSQSINLDLFLPEPNDFIRQLVIRTGSANYVSRFIAAAWRRKKWCGSDKGLRLMKDCIERKKPDGGSDWKCVNPNAELPPVWATEQEFFQWIGEPYLHPSQRNL